MHQRIGRSVLHHRMHIEPGWDDEHDRWYHQEHIPDLVATPGILGARRFRAADGQHTYLTMYQLENESVLQTDEYLEHRHNPSPWTVRIFTHHPFIRSVYNEILLAHPGSAPDTSRSEDGRTQEIGAALLHTMMNVEADWADEVSEWYEQERIPFWLSQPGVLSARRFVLSTDPAWQDPSHRVRGGELDEDFYRTTMTDEYQFMTVFELQDGSILQRAPVLAALEEVSPWAEKLFPHFISYRSVYQQHFPAAGPYEDRSGPAATNKRFV